MYNDVYLVFDRYKKFSIKGSTRSDRAKKIAYQLKFTPSTPLPCKEKILSCSSNKIQIIDIMFDFLKENVASKNFCNTLVITGSSDTPMQVTQGLNIPRHDLKTTHEEADLIIIQQCYGLIFDSGCNSVTTISDDTDVFVLACHYFPIERSDVTVIMESTKSCRAIV